MEPIDHASLIFLCCDI